VQARAPRFGIWPAGWGDVALSCIDPISDLGEKGLSRRFLIEVSDGFEGDADEDRDMVLCRARTQISEKKDLYADKHAVCVSIVIGVHRSTN
jgi:hypothetical protein